MTRSRGIFGNTGGGRARRVGYLQDRDQDPRKNIARVIEMARDGKAYGELNWTDDSWDVTEPYSARKRGHDQHRLILNFCCHRKNKEKGVGEPFDNANRFSDLTKALVCLRYQRRSQGAQNQMIFVRAFRYLHDVLHTEKRDVALINREHFVQAYALAAQRESVRSTYVIGRMLGEIARTIDQNRLSHYPIDWSGPKGRPVSAKSNADEHGSKRYDRRYPSDKVLKAVGQLYLTVPKDHWADRVRTLLVSLIALTGFRVGELLTLPARKVERDKDSKARYLIYYPEKGLPPQKKWLMSNTADLVGEIIEELLELTEEPRRVATWLEQNPGRVWLGEGFPDQVSAIELARRLSLDSKYPTNSGVSFCRVRGVPIRGSNPKKIDRSELEEALVLERFDKPVVTVLNSGDILRLKDTLAIGFLHAFHAQRSTLKYAVRPLTQQMLRVFLTGQESPAAELKSVFERYGIQDDEGQPIDVSSHGFRHWLNTALDEGGLSDLAQAEWFGRKDPRENRTYLHSTMADRAAAVRRDLLLGRMSGPVADIVMRMPIDRREAYVISRVRMVHIVPGGMCLHDFSQEPCPHHVQCKGGCGSFSHLKDDELARKELETERDVLSNNIALAEEAVKNGTFGAGEWLDLHQRKYAAVLKHLGELDSKEKKADDGTQA